jgi:hypothetical protein
MLDSVRPEQSGTLPLSLKEHSCSTFDSWVEPAQRRGHVKFTTSNLRKAQVQVFLDFPVARRPKFLDFGFFGADPNRWMEEFDHLLQTLR